MSKKTDTPSFLYAIQPTKYLHVESQTKLQVQSLNSVGELREAIREMYKKDGKTASGQLGNSNTQASVYGPGNVLAPRVN